MSNEIVNFNVKVREDIKDEFEIAAKLEGMDMSGMVRNFMIRTIREAKQREPEAFIRVPVYKVNENEPKPKSKQKKRA